jgi:hypothetical protein
MVSVSRRKATGWALFRVEEMRLRGRLGFLARREVAGVLRSAAVHGCGRRRRLLGLYEEELGWARWAAWIRLGRMATRPTGVVMASLRLYAFENWR